MSLFIHTTLGFFTGYFSPLATFNWLPIDSAYPLGWVGATFAAIAYCHPKTRLYFYGLALLIWILMPVSLFVVRTLMS